MSGNGRKCLRFEPAITNLYFRAWLASLRICSRLLSHLRKIWLPPTSVVAACAGPVPSLFEFQGEGVHFTAPAPARERRACGTSAYLLAIRVSSPNTSLHLVDRLLLHRPHRREWHGAVYQPLPVPVQCFKAPPLSGRPHPAGVSRTHTWYGASRRRSLQIRPTTRPCHPVVFGS